MPRELHLELNPNKTVFYRICAVVLRSLSFLLFRPRVQGRENIPLEGSVLIAPTHRSNLDFLFSLAMSRRKIFFMAKESLFRVPLLGPALIQLGAFPVKRGAPDREAMRSAEQVLAAGHALIMFPEGTRSEGEAILPLHDGAMFVAARTHSRVVPVGIGGSERAMPPFKVVPRPYRVTVIIGEPIEPPDVSGRATRSAVSAKTAELQEKLNDVFQRSRQR